MSDPIANDTTSNPQREELGALWKRQGKNQTYLAGYINKANGEKVKIVVFSSKNKKSVERKIELKKFCKHCRKNTVHKEGKK